MLPRQLNPHRTGSMTTSPHATVGFHALGADAVALLASRDRTLIGRALSEFRVEQRSDAEEALAALRHTGAAALVVGVSADAYQIVATVLRRVRRRATALRVAGVHAATRRVRVDDDD